MDENSLLYDEGDWTYLDEDILEERGGQVTTLAVLDPKMEI